MSKQMQVRDYLMKKKGFYAEGGEVPDDEEDASDYSVDLAGPPVSASNSFVGPPEISSQEIDDIPAPDSSLSKPIPDPPAPTDQAGLMRAYLADKYKTASDDSGVKAAQKGADWGNMISHIAEGVEGIARARGVANGGQGVNHAAYAENRAENQAGVARAEQSRQAKMQGFLRQNEMERQVAQDVMTKGTYDQKQQAFQWDKDRHDATSPYSKGMQAKFGDIHGVDASGLSAVQMDDLSKQYEAKAKIDEAKAAAELRAETQRANNEYRNTMAGQVKDAKEGKDLDGDERKFSEALDQNKARAGLKADSQKRLNNSERASALIYDEKGNLQNLNPEQMGEAAQAWAAMIGNGQVQADAAVTRLLPHTLTGKLADVKQWITSEPQGADQQAFLKMMADSIKREKVVAESQLRRAQVQSASGYDRLKKNRPDRYNAILQSAGVDPKDIDEKGQWNHQEPPETKTLEDGSTYVKVKGGWQRQKQETSH